MKKLILREFESVVKPAEVEMWEENLVLTFPECSILVSEVYLSYNEDMEDKALGLGTCLHTMFPSP